jgi:hypothetical protein
MSDTTPVLYRDNNDMLVVSRANVYLLCRDGNALMPATFLRIDEETGLAVVTSPTGIEYTANPGHLVSQEDAADMLRDRRADRLVHQGYVIMHLRADVWRCWHPGKHGIDGGYILTLGEHPTCSCLDFSKRGKPCKHIKAAPDLQRYALVKKPTIRIDARTAVA